jgi:hypothetical protein
MPRSSPSPFDVIPRYQATPPHGHLFRVEVQIIGLAIAHVWTGWANDSHDASQRGYEDARQLFSGRSLCVRNVLQVGV